MHIELPDLGEEITVERINEQFGKPFVAWLNKLDQETKVSFKEGCPASERWPSTPAYLHIASGRVYAPFHFCLDLYVTGKAELIWYGSGECGLTKTGSWQEMVEESFRSLTPLIEQFKYREGKLVRISELAQKALLKLSHEEIEALKSEWK